MDTRKLCTLHTDSSPVWSTTEQGTSHAKRAMADFRLDPALVSALGIGSLFVQSGT